MHMRRGLFLAPSSLLGLLAFFDELADALTTFMANLRIKLGTIFVARVFSANMPALATRLFDCHLALAGLVFLFSHTSLPWLLALPNILRASRMSTADRIETFPKLERKRYDPLIVLLVEEAHP
jgi:hypothetical protein